MLTETEAKYVLFLYRKQEEEGKKVGTVALAREMGVRPATVTQTLRKLASKGLLRYKPYKGVEFTPQGRKEGSELLRKHRLLESLLHRLLGYDSQTACREASSLLSVSTFLADSLCEALGHPSTCPCGKPIGKCGGK